MAKAQLVDVHVGSRMRQRGTLLGMSQSKVAEAVGLTFQQIQKYERGSNRIGSSRLYEFAKVLDVPVSYFFDEMPSNALSGRPMSGRGAATARSGAESKAGGTRVGCRRALGSWGYVVLRRAARGDHGGVSGMRRTDRPARHPRSLLEMPKSLIRQHHAAIKSPTCKALGYYEVGPSSRDEPAQAVPNIAKGTQFKRAENKFFGHRLVLPDQTETNSGRIKLPPDVQF